MESDQIGPPIVEFDDEEVSMNVTLGKLVYELAVEFGQIWIGWGEDEVSLECDSKGESLDHWVNRDLRIGARDLKKLVANYKGWGRFSLDQVSQIWKDQGKNLMGWL